MKGKAVEKTDIEIKKLSLAYLEVTIKGLTPLIVHNWSKKAKQHMLDVQQKKAVNKREIKDPDQDFKDSLYPLPNEEGYGFPSIGLKAAAIRAAKGMGITMTDARTSFHIDAEFIKIDGDAPVAREDIVRVANGQPDIRYRAQFTNWGSTFVVKFNTALISAEQIVNLINVGGFGSGIGEWRPERNGRFGTFEVSSFKVLE